MLSSLPVISFANCCCLWVIGGGVATAYLMQQGQREPLLLADGALGGCLAGLVGAFVFAVASAIVQAVTAPMRPDPDLLDLPADLPPELVEMMETFAATPGLAIAIGFVVMLVVGTPFATLGGLLGTLLFRRERSAPAGTVDILPPEDGPG